MQISLFKFQSSHRNLQLNNIFLLWTLNIDQHALNPLFIFFILSLLLLPLLQKLRIVGSRIFKVLNFTQFFINQACQLHLNRLLLFLSMHLRLRQLLLLLHQILKLIRKLQNHLIILPLQLFDLRNGICHIPFFL